MSDPWLALSLIAEPGEAALIEVLATNEVGAVVAAARGRHRLRVPETWRERASDLDGLVAAAKGRADASGLRWIARGSLGWPSQLDDLAHAEPGDGVGGTPLGLWLRGAGSLRDLAAQSVSVVGARSCTSYGAEVASELGADLADRGWIVVSGAAYGIDACAHRGALVMDSPTVAVLACGADVAYPRANTSLLDRMAEIGMVVSEQAPGATPLKHRFLSRNRIIAALTSGTVVVEASGRSGSLNTLRWADRLGRACMGVPGPVTAQMSVGVHGAIRGGQAVVVTGVDDVEAELAGLGWSPGAPSTNQSAVTQRVAAALAQGAARDVLALAKRLALPAADVRRAIAQLDRAGRATVSP